MKTEANYDFSIALACPMLLKPIKYGVMPTITDQVGNFVELSNSRTLM